jgi:hypothetical protein
MTKFEVGDWLRWTTPHHIKEGEVVLARGPSLVVRWLGGDEQVFPVYEGYVHPRGGLNARMDRIERPRGASRIERERKRGVMSVARASSILGTTPKRVRAQLRNGALKGVRKGGKWIAVDLDPD